MVDRGGVLRVEVGQVGRVGVVRWAKGQGCGGQVRALLEAGVDAGERGQAEAADLLGREDGLGVVVRRGESGVGVEGGHSCKKREREFEKNVFLG